MSIPLEDLEQQLRTHYQQELGEPISSSALWSQLAGHLPAQEHPVALWRRWLKAAFASPNWRQPSARRLTPTRRIVVACALLLGVLLLGSGVVYTTGMFTPHQGHSPSNQSAVSANADALLLRLLLNDPHPVGQQVVRQGLFSQINQTRAVQSGTVRLQKVYADANNIILGYTYAATQTSGNLLMPVPTLTLPDGSKLEPQILVSDLPPSGLFTVVAYFNGGSFQSDTQQVRLNISIATEGAPAHFDPLVPFSNGKTVQIHQTATVAGRTVMLNRVVITPSEARFYYISSQGVELGALSIAGKNYIPDGASFQSDTQQVRLNISIATEGAPAHIDLLVPFSNGKTVQIHRRVTVAGRTVTLNRVVITPSEARFYYISSQGVEPGALSIAGKNYILGGIGYMVHNPGEEHYISFSNNLQNVTGSWTAKFFSNSVSNEKRVSKFLMQFTFTVA